MDVIITGSVGFVIGFIGTIIFSESNQGLYLEFSLQDPLVIF